MNTKIKNLGKLSDKELDKYIKNNFRASLIALGTSKYSKRDSLTIPLLVPEYKYDEETGEDLEYYSINTMYCDSPKAFKSVVRECERVVKEGSYVGFETLGEFNY